MKKLLAVVIIFSFPLSIFARVQVASVLPNVTKEPDEEYFEIQNT